MELSSSLAIPKITVDEEKDNYGRFIAQPLGRGFGITLGNALRRVLLSSLPGAAINWVKIDGVFHEFTAIPYVKEDAIELILNIKALRLRPTIWHEGKLFLEATGEREVCGADIAPSADFEIANPELHLATLDSDEARLSIEFNVIIGKGYIPAGQSNNLPIGVIPVDAIFTPVWKANYTVGNLANRQEKLTLEVWTDNTISPTKAMGDAAQILVEQFSAFRSLGAEPQAEIAKAVPPLPEQHNLPVEQLGLKQATLNVLRRNKITKVADLVGKSDKELLSLKRMGQKALEELKERLAELGIDIEGQG
jgi:DNA-directed RNA polymerase subunit alpha